jgi:hypothetical protein
MISTVARSYGFVGEMKGAKIAMNRMVRKTINAATASGLSE